MVRELARHSFVLHSVRSEDLDTCSGLAEVTADLHRHGRDDLALEAAVNRLSIEPAVSSLSWNVCEPAALLSAEE